MVLILKNPNRYLTDHRPVYQYLVCHLIVPINVLKTVDCTGVQNSLNQIYTDPLSFESRSSLPDNRHFQLGATIKELPIFPPLDPVFLFKFSTIFDLSP